MIGCDDVSVTFESGRGMRKRCPSGATAYAWNWEV
jgi:hypothetical protein